MTSFIGRERELAQAKLALSRARLLTLIGPGGCGKTRLAYRMAADLVPGYAHGIYCVELASLSDPAMLPQAVAAALGVHELPQVPLAQTLSQHLASRRLLLVLDNCEHLLHACLELVSLLLGTAADLQVLTTSRQPLGIPGEAVWLVPPLSMPEPAPDRSPEPAELNQLMHYDAVRLFVERAAAVRPGFTLTAENAAAVMQTCQRLDGLPLALELAAARVRLLTVAQIAARLDDRFNLLNGGNRTALLPRHQTLRAAIDWSYQLLSEPERLLLRRLSVFTGSFALETVEPICAADDLPRSELLDALSGLVEQSLAQVVDVDERHGARYRLLETIRQFASEKLGAAGELDRLQMRHASYYLRLAEEAQAGLSDRREEHWSGVLAREHDNLLAALDWLLGGDEAEAGLRLAVALCWFWDSMGFLEEPRRRLAHALERNPDAPAALRAQAVVTMGRSVHLQGDFALGRSLIEQGLELARALGDRSLMASALYGLAGVGMSEKDFTQAGALFADCLAVQRALGDAWGVARSLNALGEVARLQGLYEQAQALYREASAACRRLGQVPILAMPLSNLGYILLMLGDSTNAAAPLAESLALAHKFGNRIQIGLSLTGLASVASAHGHPLEAARLLGAADHLLELSTIHMDDAAYWIEHDRIAAAVQSALANEAYAAAYAEGRAIPVEHAVREALSFAAPSQLLVGTSQPALRIRALGAAEVLRDEQSLVPSAWSYAKSRELFYFLLAHRSCTREQIGLALWPDASPTQLHNRLGAALYRLRRALGRPDWIVCEHEQYRFNRALPYWFDLEDFEAHLAEASRLRAGDPAQAIRHLAEAAQLYRGDFLAEANLGDWCLPLREQTRRRYLEALLSLGQLRAAVGDYAGAAETYRRAIAEDSYLEAAHRELMQCYARLGERAQLQRHYRALEALLRDELGTAPAAETTALFDRLSRGLE